MTSKNSVVANALNSLVFNARVSYGDSALKVGAVVIEYGETEPNKDLVFLCQKFDTQSKTMVAEQNAACKRSNLEFDKQVALFRKAHADDIKGAESNKYQKDWETNYLPKIHKERNEIDAKWLPKLQSMKEQIISMAKSLGYKCSGRYGVVIKVVTKHEKQKKDNRKTFKVTLYTMYGRQDKPHREVIKVKAMDKNAAIKQIDMSHAVDYKVEEIQKNSF